MSNDSVLNRLVERAKALRDGPGHGPEDFERLFRELSPADTAELLTNMSEGAASIVETDWINDYFVYLHRDGEVNLQIMVIGSDTPADELCANEFDLVLMNISPHDIEVPVYRTDIVRFDLALRPSMLVAGEPLSLVSHRPVVIRAYKEILDLRSVTEPTALLIFHSAARGPVTWVFDRATGNPMHLTSTNLQGSRIQLAARLLGAIGGSSEDVAALTAIASSDEAGFIRWEAVEALYRLDPDAGHALLRDRLVRDNDRVIRKAATATLARLG